MGVLLANECQPEAASSDTWSRWQAWGAVGILANDQHRHQRADIR
jgi:hypothetical protein